MSHFVAIHLDLHCLSNNSFTCSYLKGVLRNEVCFSDVYGSTNATGIVQGIHGFHTSINLKKIIVYSALSCASRPIGLHRNSNFWPT